MHHQLSLLFSGQGPGGIWCDVDVVEFSYYGVPAPAPKEQLYTKLVDELRGADSCIGSGSQVYSTPYILRILIYFALFESSIVYQIDLAHP